MVVGAGCRTMVVGDGWRTVQRHLGGRLGDLTLIDTSVAHPRSRVYGPSHKPLMF